MSTTRISLIVLGFIAIVAYFTLFTVLEVKNAIVLQFGDPKRVITEPGLNFKIPFIQNVIFIDNRILDIDAPAAEVIASDQKRLIVDAYVKFKIVDVLEFYKAFGNENVARSRISAVVNSRIRGVLGEEPLSAVLSDDRSKLMKQITSLAEAEVKNFGIEIRKPDVNESQLNFINHGDNEILYGLGAIKGLGKSAIENIILEREGKPFENLFDFCARVDLSKVDKRGIEPLIKSGAMDSFNLSRKEMLESLEDAMKYAKQNTMTQESGISDLFGGISESSNFIQFKKSSREDIGNSKFEFSALGFYLKTHPVEEHYWELKKLGTREIRNVIEETVNTISGVIVRQNRIQTRRGPLVFATLDDGTDRIELIISSEVLESFEGNLSPQTIYLATGDVTFEKDPQKKNIGLQKKMRVTDIKSLEVARIRSVTKLKINIEGQEQKDVLNIVENLKAIALVENNSQGSQIEMQYNLDSGSANIELDKDFRILLNDDNMDKLVENCGKENIDFQYRAR